jgi:hypothetical protein
MCFNRDHLLRNAAWDCLAREHHGRRDGRDGLMSYGTSVIDGYRKTGVGNASRSDALTQLIYTKHSFDQELLFRPSFASFPKPNTSSIHSSSKQRCRAGIMIDLNASERDRLSPQQR